ncbi:2,6-dihydropseudooxynicotine hydrolase [Pleurostoma richardsiae]|uniref:2,6-dihydropseudooxynicotine hydrolase n=1 Tax=Pleurostoma richardsiae TaxID=41990 RepID=A0AA38RCB8_9PEZI|nr:2,6-dihydropseudooxynicotine hydrolase [Pleurostoma richardsiae]
MWPLSTDGEFDFMLAETLSLSNNFGANTGEVLRAAAQITPGDFESFYREFKFLADAIHDKAVATKNPVASREAYFRAATYYRAADFFLHGNVTDPRLATLWDSQLADFESAIKLLPRPGEKITVQGPNFTIPMYFYPAAPDGPNSAPSCGKKLPTILAGNGYDGSQEALYHSMGRAITARGWNFATFEGPGQPTVRRQQGIGFIHDWWEVVTPAVDCLLSRPDVDDSRIALTGFSFSGTLAPIAASREKRLAALLCIDGLYSMYATLRAKFPAELLTLYDSGNKTAFDEAIMSFHASSLAPSNYRWVVDQGLWAFNTASPYVWFQKISQITLDGVLDKIHIPVFVGKGENDDYAPGQPEEVAAQLGNLSYLYEFKTELGAGQHCQIGAEAQLAEASLDWLEGVFDKVVERRV